MQIDWRRDFAKIQTMGRGCLSPKNLTLLCFAGRFIGSSMLVAKLGGGLEKEENNDPSLLVSFRNSNDVPFRTQKNLSGAQMM